jgi:hypothetical protein
MEKIKDRILKFLHLDDIINSLSGYVEARVELIKIEIREEVAGILSRGLMIMLIFMIGFLFFLFLCFGLAQYLNTLLESQFAGYLIVALFFGLVLLVLLLFRKSFFKLLEKQFVELIRHRQQ